MGNIKPGKGKELHILKWMNLNLPWKPMKRLKKWEINIVICLFVNVKLSFNKKHHQKKKKKKKKKAVEAPITMSTGTTTTTTNLRIKDEESGSDDDSGLEGLEGESWHPKPKQILPIKTEKEEVRPDWCQSNKLLTITLFVKGLKKEDVSVTCEKKLVDVKITTPKGETWEKKYYLWGLVKPHKMKWSVSRVKLEISIPLKITRDTTDQPWSVAK